MDKKRDSALFKSGRDWRNNACLNFNGIDINAYATGYKQAADFLVEQVRHEGRHQDTLVYPIAFLYRQYLELTLKHLIDIGTILLEGHVPNKNLSHMILTLWKQCRNILERIDEDSIKENIGDIDEVERLLSDFDLTDPSSTAFRYPTDRNGNPSLPDISHINLTNLAAGIGKIAELLDGGVMQIEYLLDIKHEMESWE